MRARDEGGFVLLAVLWALVLVTGVATLYLADTRHMMGVSANRGAELRARQGALAGQAHAGNLLDHLHARTSDRALLFDRDERLRLLRAWNDLDSTVAASAGGCLGSTCYRTRVRDLGRQLNVNTAGEARLKRLFLHLGVDEHDAETAAQSIADWIDHDDRPRPFGAEDPYYSSVLAPYRARNGPIPDLSELRRIRGVHPAVLEVALPYLGLEGATINLNTAPLPVLVTLPGVDSVVARTIAAHRRRSGPITDPSQLLTLVRGGARARLEEDFTTVRALVAVEPQVVEVLSVGWHRGSPIQVTLRTVYTRGTRGVTPRHRSRTDR